MPPTASPAGYHLRRRRRRLGRAALWGGGGVTPSITITRAHASTRLQLPRLWATLLSTAAWRTASDNATWVSISPSSVRRKHHHHRLLPGKCRSHQPAGNHFRHPAPALRTNGPPTSRGVTQHHHPPALPTSAQPAVSIFTVSSSIADGFRQRHLGNFARLGAAGLAYHHRLLPGKYRNHPAGGNHFRHRRRRFRTTTLTSRASHPASAITPPTANVSSSPAVSALPSAATSLDGFDNATWVTSISPSPVRREHCHHRLLPGKYRNHQPAGNHFRHRRRRFRTGNP